MSSTSCSGMPAIQAVIDNDLCIACGACIEACPADSIQPAYNHKRAAQEVEITSSNACTTCNAPCEQVCPSISVDFGLADEHKKPDRLGPILEVLTGYSPEYMGGGTSSSGGVLRQLVAHSLKKNIPVVTLGKKADPPLQNYNAMTLNYIDQLDHVPGSIYHSVSFSDAIPQLRKLERPCLLIAIPCHLEGLLKYIQRHEPELEQKLGFIAGLVCGWMYTDHSLKSFARFKGIGDTLVDAGYRGEDKVGKLKLVTEDDMHHYERRKFDSAREMLDFSASFSTDANRLRCRVCQDHTNLQADIAVGDAWLRTKLSQKHSIVIVRTDRGKAWLGDMREQGELVLERATTDDILESQSPNLVMGYQARKLAKYLDKKGIRSPRFEYDDNSEAPPLTASDRFQFKIEMIKRRLLRGGHYRLYRLIYAATRLRRIVNFIIAGK